jgi:predicted amidohydrolase
VPNASEMNDTRTACLRTRAYENMIGVALTNYAEPQADGHSAAFDPIAYRPITESPDGGDVDPLVVRAGRGEGVTLATFDLDRVRSFRACETQGDAYRKPSLYGPLLDSAVAAPFRRDDARR